MRSTECSSTRRTWITTSVAYNHTTTQGSAIVRLLLLLLLLTAHSPSAQWGHTLTANFPPPVGREVGAMAAAATRRRDAPARVAIRLARRWQQPACSHRAMSEQRAGSERAHNLRSR